MKGEDVFSWVFSAMNSNDALVGSLRVVLNFFLSAFFSGKYHGHLNMTPCELMIVEVKSLVKEKENNSKIFFSFLNLRCRL